MALAQALDHGGERLDQAEVEAQRDVGKRAAGGEVVQERRQIGRGSKIKAPASASARR
jgi:hypothetical protein